MHVIYACKVHWKDHRGLALWHSELSCSLWFLHLIMEHWFVPWLFSSWWAPCWWAGKGSRKCSNAEATATCVRDQDGVPGLWLRPNPALIIAAAWGVNQVMDQGIEGHAVHLLSFLDSFQISKLMFKNIWLLSYISTTTKVFPINIFRRIWQYK